jgi:radical SAM-linked protein
MKVRIKFTKTGILKYIGHLDLMRYFQKALRRTDIDVMYSKGFSPHMIMSFAQPLGVGVESLGEYFDLEIADTEDVSLIKDKLNVTMAEGITIEAVCVLPEKSENAMASVKAADYYIDFYDKKPDFTLLNETYLNSSELFYEKETKSGKKEINVKEFTFDFKIEESGLFIRTDASSGGNLKPGAFLEALFKKANLDLNEYKYHVMRQDLYTLNENNEFVSLGLIYA